MVFQRFNLFPHMNVLQNLMLAPMKVRGVILEEGTPQELFNNPREERTRSFLSKIL